MPPRWASARDGRKLLFLAKGQTVNYAGAHTAVLEPATPASSVVPVGSGWATASVSTSGVMTLAGRLGDGTVFTSALNPDAGANPSYRLFVQPYTTARTESFLTGSFTLVQHPNSTSNPSLTNRRYLESAGMIWKKTGISTDASYRTNFGPVTTVLMIDPWLAPFLGKAATKTAPPLPAITLADRLGLTGTSISFAVTHSPTDSAANGNLPTLLGLSAKNAVSVLAPVTTPLANSTEWKTITFNTTTGAFTGSFELLDGVLKRPVTFSGVLRQPALNSDTLIGDGHYLAPPLSGTARTTGEIMFTRP